MKEGNLEVEAEAETEVSCAEYWTKIKVTWAKNFTPEIKWT